MFIIFGFLIPIAIFIINIVIKARLVKSKSDSRKITKPEGNHNSTLSKKDKVRIEALRAIRLTLKSILVAMNTLKGLCVLVISFLSVFWVCVIVMLVCSAGIIVAVVLASPGTEVSADGSATISLVSDSSTASNATWLSAVDSMGQWYVKNINTYQGATSGKGTGHRTSYSCDLLNGKTVGDDCSSFVTACLAYAGYFDGYAGTGSAYDSRGYLSSGNASGLLHSVGFTSYDITSGFVLQAGDIVSVDGHVEIVSKVEVDEKGKQIVYAYTWGAVYQAEPVKKSEMPVYIQRYTTCWRCG